MRENCHVHDVEKHPSRGCPRCANESAERLGYGRSGSTTPASETSPESEPSDPSTRPLGSWPSGNSRVNGGTGGAPSPSHVSQSQRVRFELSGSGANEWGRCSATVRQVHSWLSSEGASEGEFTFTLSLVGLTRSQAALIGHALGLSGPDISHALDRADVRRSNGWDGPALSFSIPTLELATTPPSTPQRTVRKHGGTS